MGLIKSNLQNGVGSLYREKGVNLKEILIAGFEDGESHKVASGAENDAWLTASKEIYTAILFFSQQKLQGLEGT